ncbi:hypothetical protein [Winogradskyella sp. A3E31]|uniref:hypothetical protein n=1 Tax=Winogradskyella sp. A3E31 TaxID=3349637 RepID=UPI00398AE1C1
MKKLAVLLFILPLLCFAQEPPAMVEMVEVDVKFGHEPSFYKAMTEYNACLKENNWDGSYEAWWRRQGEGTQVVFVRDIMTYGDLDNDSSEASEKCQNDHMPDLTSHSRAYRSSYMVPLTDWSASTPPVGKVVNVMNFDVHDPFTFGEIIQEIVGTVKDAEGYNAHWLGSKGGDTHDFSVVFFYDSFAEMGEDRFNPWAIYAKKHGEEKLKKMRSKLTASIKNVTEFMYQLDETISYRPSED